MKMPRSLALRVRFTPRAASAGILAGLVCAGPAVAVNFSCAWNITSGGSWSTAADWTSCNGSDPNNSGGNTYDATIAGSGSYTVTLSSPVTIGTLTLNDGGATLANSSTLTTTNGVTLQAGTIQGGTIVRSGGTTAVALSGSSAVGTLNGVTLHGSLDVTGASAEALFNGLVVTDITGTKPGVINVTGSSAYLYSTATQTLNNATVHLGGTTGPAYLYAPTGTLTLGSGLHMLSDGASASYGEIYGATIVNDGAISFSNGSTQNRIVPSAFTNAGTVTVQNGTSLQIGSTNGVATPTFINAGTVTVNGSGGATALEIGSQSNPQGVQLGQEWRNSGTISITDTDLRLGGYFKTSDIGTINRTGGTTELVGYLDNSGSTLSALPGMTMAQGTIHGGTVTSALAGSLYSVTSAIGTLDTVQVNGPLQVTGQSAEVFFNNLVVKDATGTTPGIINVTGNGAYLYSTATQTLNNATVHLGGTTGSAYLYSATGTLTLGSGLNVLSDGAGSYGYIYGTTIVNDGTITFSSGSNQGRIVPTTFTNNGTIISSNGSVAVLNPTTFTNIASGTLARGTYVVNSGSTMTFYGTTAQPTTVTTLAANVQLNGAGSTLQSFNANTNLYTTLDSSLTSIAASGSLAINTGRNFTTAGNLDNLGILSVGSGSKFDVHGNLLNFSGSTLTGGTYNVSGTLQFNGANIATNAAAVTLSGATSQIINQSGANGLASFATNASTGSFTVGGGRVFTTAGAFTNNGSLTTTGTGSRFTTGSAHFINNGTLTSTGGDSEIATGTGAFTNAGTVTVAGGSTLGLGASFTNFSGTTLSGGAYNVGGTFQFAGANIVTNAASIVLTGSGSTILNSTNKANALANFASNASTGSFSLLGGGALTTTGNFSNAGTLAIGAGSTLTLAGPGNFTQTAGKLTDDGTLSTSGSVTLSGGSVFGKGLIKGALQSSAVITPGDSATATGILTDSGAYKQNSGGSLDVSIGGATAGSGYDQLNPTTASLGGTLNIKLINGFVPKLGSTFKILNYGSETGHFATVNGLAINSGEHFALTYQSTDVLLTVMSGPSGARSSSMGASSYPRLADASSLSQTVAGARLRLAQPSTSAGVFSAASRAGLQPGSGVHRPGRFGGRATSANLQFSLLKPLSMPAFFLAVE